MQMNMKNKKEMLSELLGIMLGDGCLSSSGSKYFVYICGHKTNDFKYHDQITRKLFKELFDKDIKIQFRSDENTLFIRFSDKEIFNFLRKYLPVGSKYEKMKVPKVVRADLKYANCLIRGFFDTDGCIILSKQHRKNPYYPRIEIPSKSRKFLEEILKILKSQGFYGSISRKANCARLEIPGFANLERWESHVGTNHSLKKQKIAKILDGRKFYKQTTMSN